MTVVRSLSCEMSEGSAYTHISLGIQNGKERKIGELASCIRSLGRHGNAEASIVLLSQLFVSRFFHHSICLYEYYVFFSRKYIKLPFSY